MGVRKENASHHLKFTPAAQPRMNKIPFFRHNTNKEDTLIRKSTIRKEH